MLEKKLRGSRIEIRGEEVLSTGLAAEKLGISVQTLRRWVDDKDKRKKLGLEVYRNKLTNYRYVTAESLDALMDHQDSVFENLDELDDYERLG